MVHLLEVEVHERHEVDGVAVGSAHIMSAARNECLRRCVQRHLCGMQHQD